MLQATVLEYVVALIVLGLMYFLSPLLAQSGSKPPAAKAPIVEEVDLVHEEQAVVEELDESDARPEKANEVAAKAEAQDEAAAKLPPQTLRHCLACGKAGESLLRCSRCRSAHFCSRECQRMAWPSHKRVCTAAPAPAILQPPHADRQPSSFLADNLSCPVSLELFDDPVQTPCCGNSLSRTSLRQSLVRGAEEMMKR